MIHSFNSFLFILQLVIVKYLCFNIIILLLVFQWVNFFKCSVQSNYEREKSFIFLNEVFLSNKTQDDKTNTGKLVEISNFNRYESFYIEANFSCSVYAYVSGGLKFLYGLFPTNNLSDYIEGLYQHPQWIGERIVGETTQSTYTMASNKNLTFSIYFNNITNKVFSIQTFNSSELKTFQLNTNYLYFGYALSYESAQITNATGSIKVYGYK